MNIISILHNNGFVTVDFFWEEPFDNDPAILVGRKIDDSGSKRIVSMDIESGQMCFYSGDLGQRIVNIGMESGQICFYSDDKRSTSDRSYSTFMVDNNADKFIADLNRFAQEHRFKRECEVLFALSPSWECEQEVYPESDRLLLPLLVARGIFLCIPEDQSPPAGEILNDSFAIVCRNFLERAQLLDPSNHKRLHRIIMLAREVVGRCTDTVIEDRDTAIETIMRITDDKEDAIAEESLAAVGTHVALSSVRSDSQKSPINHKT